MILGFVLRFLIIRKFHIVLGSKLKSKWQAGIRMLYAAKSSLSRHASKLQPTLFPCPVRNKIHPSAQRGRTHIFVWTDEIFRAHTMWTCRLQVCNERFVFNSSDLTLCSWVKAVPLNLMVGRVHARVSHRSFTCFHLDSFFRCLGNGCSAELLALVRPLLMYLKCKYVRKWTQIEPESTYTKKKPVDSISHEWTFFEPFYFCECR